MSFYLSPINRIILIQKIKNNPALKQLFKQNNDVTSKINDDIRIRLNGLIDNFLTIHFTGSQGSLKTSCAVSIAKKFDPTFIPSERVCFQYEEYLESMQTSQPKQFRQIDEQAFMRGTGSQRMIQEIQEHIETLRKRQNSLIICTPEKKYFPDSLFTYMFETIDNELIATCPTNPIPHEPRLCTCYENKTAQVIKARVRSAVKVGDHYIGFYIIELDWGNPEWKDYETSKDAFMERVAHGDKKRTDYEKIAETILAENPDNDLYRNRKALRILVQKNRPNLTIGEAEMVIESICMTRRKR